MRFRLTLWYSALLLLLGLAFVVSLNVAARLDKPDEQRVLAEMDMDEGTGWRAVDGAAVAEEGEASPAAPARLAEEMGSEFHSENLDRLRLWSIVAVIGLALASGAGGYALSGFLLRPVRDITQVASEIGAGNLSRRIGHRGPDDELKGLADTFDSMIERIESGFETQRRFVQDASHELRTPLTAIRTNIEVAELELGADGGEERLPGLLGTVKAQTDRLARLGDDLLLLTSPEATVAPLDPPERVDVRGLAAAAAAELGPLAARAGVHLHVAGGAPREAIASADLLYRCALNLIDNAVKHSGEGASVVIEAGGDGEEVWLRVRDTGPGIPAEHLEHVFERFYRVDRSRARGRGGAGLGLAIVRALAESMGGSVEARSTAGEGAAFTLRLPRAPDDHAEDAPPADA